MYIDIHMFMLVFMFIYICIFTHLYVYIVHLYCSGCIPPADRELLARCGVLRYTLDPSLCGILAAGFHCCGLASGTTVHNSKAERGERGKSGQCGLPSCPARQPGHRHACRLFIPSSVGRWGWDSVPWGLLRTWSWHLTVCCLCAHRFGISSSSSSAAC